MRAPSPVLTNAVAMKNAATTSHTTVFPNPAVASAMVRVPDITAKATPTNAIAPMGRGRRMMPRMVATNTARSCHARGSTPSGVGTSHTAAPTAATTPSRAASTRGARTGLGGASAMGWYCIRPRWNGTGDRRVVAGITVLVLEGGAYRDLGVFGPGDAAESRVLDGFAADVRSVFDAPKPDA